MDYNSSYWNGVAENTPKGQDYDDILAEHYRLSHLKLLSHWIDFSKPQNILKTDLFAEAMCPTRSFAWEILKTPSNFTGMDISSDICRIARETAAKIVPDKSPSFASCDLRKLPFADSSFDVIISDSSLDHYNNKAEIEIGINELVRILKPGGTLVITLDNKTNFTEPLFRLWIILKLAPYFIGKTYTMKELKYTLNKTGLKIENSCTLIHNPRFFTKVMIAAFRRFFPRRCEDWTKKRLAFYDTLGNKRTKYLTAQFIAVKASKPTV
ncbi:MAG: methyltransferase domain-containing protein [Dehalococcoidales bacterium]|nr:methyltransferase domain-containing protein [Dehalococcoidales bacterium]